MQLGRRAQILLIIAVGLAVYYPALLAQLCVIDDFDMVASLGSAEWSFKSLFMPGSSNGFYYRPLIGLSFLADRYLFEFNPVLLHLHNVLLHILNAILVYCLSHSLVRFRKASRPWFPLAAALVFCLHPVATESVAWISGRTDLLASVFVLASAIMLLQYRMLQQKRYIILSLCLFLLATLTKEVSLAFFPGMVLMLAAKEGESEPETGKRMARAFCLAGLATMLLFFLLRSLAFTSSVNRIGMTLVSIKNDPLHAVMVVLGAFGFYMKKIVLPLPLSFAIVEVDPLYQLLALPLIAFCLYLLTRRTMTSALYLCGVFLIAPSFVIAFNQIAWTPYAERYVYLPTTFLVISMLFYLGERLPAAHPQLGRWMVIVLLPVMATATFARNLTWQDNFSLVKDTVGKSPYFLEVRLIYANLLLERGDLGEALLQAKSAISASIVVYDERPELYVAQILASQGQTGEALQVLDQLLKKKKDSPAALQQMVTIWKDKVRLSPGPVEAAANSKKLLESYRLLHLQSKDPAHLYNMGLVSASLKQTGSARRFFQRAIASPKLDLNLKEQARKEIVRLGAL